MPSPSPVSTGGSCTKMREALAVLAITVRAKECGLSGQW